MAYGDENDFGWCNLMIKFTLFVMNFIVWLLGCLLLAAGIFAQVESGTLNQFGVGNLLSSPSIILIILGGVLFLLGFCGCFGALREIFILLVIYAIIMSVIVIAEVGIAVFIYFQQENVSMRVAAIVISTMVLLAQDVFRNNFQTYIENYYDDADLQDLVDLVQQSLECCGSTGPDDWQGNIYFNCSSIAYQRCSVPFSCCIPEDGGDVVINVQCGYRTLDASLTDRYLMGIYTTGCLTQLENLVQAYLYYIAGVGIGLLVFQLINILLTAGLAVDVRKEQKAIGILKKRNNREKKLNKDMGKL